MELTKLKCKCGHHYKIHASIEGCLACEGHYCGEGQVSILENAHTALQTANAKLMEALEPFVADWENSWLGDDNDKADPDGSYGHSAKLTAGDVRKAREAIRKHKGEVK